MKDAAAVVDTVLVKVASRCNIDCSYCYVYHMGDERWRDMPALMTERTVEQLVSSLYEVALRQDRGFAVVLHGGEPLMLGPRRLECLLRRLRVWLPAASHPICLQTNGVLLTEDVLDICNAYAVTISVSIDGPRPIHDKFRIGKKGEGTHSKTLRGIERLKSHRASAELFSGVLAVINPLSDPSAVYSYLKSLGAPSIDFLYRDGNHSKLPFAKSTTTSTEYGSWLVGVLDVYLRDPNPPRVRVLDDLIRLVLGGSGTKEGVGGQSFGIVVIDTDGTISKNDTLKSTFHGADRFNGEWSLGSGGLAQFLRSDDYQGYVARQMPSAPKCQSCQNLAVCGGGMPLHRWRQDTGFDNPSVYCEDQQLVIRTIRARLAQAGIQP